MSAAKKQEDKVELASQWSGQVNVVDLLNLSGDASGALAVGEELTPEQVVSKVLDHRVHHVCQRSHPFFEKELNCSALMSSDPGLFIAHPLASIIEPLNVTAQSEQDLTSVFHKFKGTGDKGIVLSKVEAGLARVTKSMTLVNDVCSIVDELFTNAVFNAPHSKGGKNQDVSRTKKNVSVVDQKVAKISVGVSDDQIAVVCQDEYGSLDVGRLLERIKSCYTNGVASTINMGQGGAGIGSYMVFNTCLSYYIAVSPGVQTTVAGVLPLRMSARKRATLPKNLHCVVY